MTGRKRCRQEPASASSSKKAKLQVTKVTGREHDRQHQTLSWLRCEMDRDNVHLASLHCALCKKYEGHLQSFKSFNAAWITGSTNQKVSNVLEHAGSEVHAQSRDVAKEGGVRESTWRVGCVVFAYRLRSVDSRSYHASKNGADIRCVLHDGTGGYSVC